MPCHCKPTHQPTKRDASNGEGPQPAPNAAKECCADDRDDSNSLKQTAPAQEKRAARGCRPRCG